MSARRFPATIVRAIRDAQVIGVRAGAGAHRVIGIWAVVVQGRVFVRSWGVKEHGWYSTFVAEPLGVMTVGSRRFRVRAVRTRSERLKDAVSDAYREKYHTPGSLKYVRDMARRKSRDTTTELVPGIRPQSRIPDRKPRAR